MLIKKYLFLTCCTLVISFICIQDISAQETDSEYTPGFIFNTSNLLLNLDSYEGGIGFLMSSPRTTWRFSVGFGYESGTEVFSSQFGITYLCPIFTGRVSPYWGGTIFAGYSHDTDEVDADNWTKENEFSLSAGVLLGVELVLDPRISFFAEYSVGADVAWVTQISSVSGSVSTTGSNNWSVGTELGNNGSIGVIIYLGKEKNTETSN